MDGDDPSPGSGMTPGRHTGNLMAALACQWTVAAGPPRDAAGGRRRPARPVTRAVTRTQRRSSKFDRDAPGPAGCQARANSGWPWQAAAPRPGWPGLSRLAASHHDVPRARPGGAGAAAPGPRRVRRTRTWRPTRTSLSGSDSTRAVALAAGHRPGPSRPAGRGPQPETAHIEVLRRPKTRTRT